MGTSSTEGALPLTLLLGLALAAALAWLARGGLRREPTPRVLAAGRSALLPGWAMELGLWAVGPITRAAVRRGLSPDLFTWASLLLHLAAAALLAMGSFGWGGWLLALGALCDAVDGAVARARGVASDAGEVLDAAIDRWAEMAVFFALAWHYRLFAAGFFLACAACAGAVMSSYARAKGEAFGVDARMGAMQRHERGAWLAGAAILSGLWQAWRPGPEPRHLPVLVALGLIAVLANWTGWLRVRHVRRSLSRR